MIFCFKKTDAEDVFFFFFFFFLTVYSEKQLKDIKILYSLWHLIKFIVISVCMHLIVLSICNYSEYQINSTLHCLQYIKAPNVVTFYYETSQTFKIEFNPIVLACTLMPMFT